MADAPSGGSTWEPFEIAIVILLAIGLLMHLQGGTTSPSQPSSQAVTAPSEDKCGLTLSRPQSLEKVYGFVTLVGTTSGCTWESTDTVALYAQVIDAKGKPVSAYTTVSAINLAPGTTTFSMTIPLFGEPQSGKGYVILVPTRDQGIDTTNLRIPITFAH